MAPQVRGVGEAVEQDDRRARSLVNEMETQAIRGNLWHGMFPLCSMLMRPEVFAAVSANLLRHPLARSAGERRKPGSSQASAAASVAEARRRVLLEASTSIGACSGD